MIETKTKSNSEEAIKNILTKNVNEWFFSKFKEFSLPQSYGVMEIHSRNNTLVSAPTGSSKTKVLFLECISITP